jgi:hypothetical protein
MPDDVTLLVNLDSFDAKRAAERMAAIGKAVREGAKLG